MVLARGEVDRMLVARRRKVTVGEQRLVVRIPSRRRHIAAAEAGGECVLRSLGIEAGLQGVTIGELAGQTLTNTHSGVGVGQEVIEGPDAVDIGLRHSGFAVYLARDTLTQPALALDLVEHAFALGPFALHEEPSIRAAIGSPAVR